MTTGATTERRVRRERLLDPTDKPLAWSVAKEHACTFFVSRGCVGRKVQGYLASIDRTSYVVVAVIDDKVCKFKFLRSDVPWIQFHEDITISGEQEALQKPLRAALDPIRRWLDANYFS